MTSRTGVQAVFRVGRYTCSHIVKMYLIFKKSSSTPIHICKELIAIYYVHEVFYLNYELMAVGLNVQALGRGQNGRVGRMY